MMTTAEIHSRSSSRQSQLEMPVDNFYSKPTMHDSCSQDNFMISTRRGSHSLANEPIFIGRNELEQLRRQHGNAINPYEFETHSLPRRTCIHHQQEEQYHTHSLPRREHHHHYLEHSANTNNATVEQILEKRRLSSSTAAVAVIQDSPQPSYVNVNSVADTYSLSRRSSSASHQHHQQQQQQQVPSLAITMASQQHSQQHQSSSSSHQKHHQALQQVPPNDEMCSTCSSETQTESETENDEDEENDDGGDSQGEEEEEEEGGSEDEEGGSEEEEEEEKEIFIDFKPNISHTQPKAELTANAATVKKSKKLIKAMSEGEILLENNEKGKQKPTSASEDDLQLQQQQQQHLQQKAYAENLYYNNSPIRDEDICC
jgi:hypothetical protein